MLEEIFGGEKILYSLNEDIMNLKKYFNSGKNE
jgi:hypothetical protein